MENNKLRKESGRNWNYDGRVLTKEIPLKSSKREDVLTWIYNIHLVEWYTTYLLKRTIEQGDTADKIQEIYVEICKVPQEKWDDLYEQGYYSISAFVAGLIHRQIISDSSTLYYKYNRYKEKFVTMEDSFWQSFYGSDSKDCEELDY